MIIPIIKELIICLIITIVIEYIPIVIFLQISMKYFIAVNVLTNVVVNVVILVYDITNAKYYLAINRWQLVIVIEILVCAVEIFLYYIYATKKISATKNYNNKININIATKTFLITTLANDLSFTIGSKLLVLMM